MVRFHMRVYGCQMNVYDSDRVRTALIRRGWREAEESDAELVIFTGCSVRGKAEQKVWSELGRYETEWRKNKRPLVALTGCIAQSLGKKAFTRYPWVTLISGPRHIGLLPDALMRVIENGSRVTLLDEDPREFCDLDEYSDRRDNVYRAYVTIAHGCDNFCSYCIVPYVRGRFVSRRPDSILSEVKALVKSGAKEITLLGQNVNSYGSDFQKHAPDLAGYGFAALLRDVARSDGVGLVRFVTSLPQDFTEKIVGVMVGEPNVAPSLNLPIQSGSDKILKLMNRKYTRSEYIEKVQMIRSYLPGLGLASDLIVGFPGETDKDFEDSMSALAEIRFDLLHSAAYSEREGTPASTMPGALPQRVRMERLNRLNALQDSITLSINQSLVGRKYRVLVDSSNNELLQGRTPTDKVVLLENSSENPSEREGILGQFVDVEITEGKSWCLKGRVVDNK
ncbi:tRNA-2-methylthio-N(6)-dimethylallyladenosine synthase [Synergistales bacterium]|nr:tRNA-2-methylthio-N(6)-dimethylallyladenosine synthase [Synergistales bacterium]